MHLFIAEFHTKCFVVNSSKELDNTIRRLNNKNLDIMIQDIIPGTELYSFSTYLNKKSQPLAVCGYDKLRQSPPDFGIGTLWRSAWKEEPIDLAIKVLQAINYYGIAEPEFKKDPRDGQYKFLEINARTIIPNALPVKCGTDVIYTAYLDALGKYRNGTIHPRDGILWVSEVGDLRSCIRQLFSRKLSVREIIKSLRGKKVYATASRDDLLPFIVSLLNYTGYYLKRVFGIRNRDENS
jgi:D-aspartate ligase